MSKRLQGMVGYNSKPRKPGDEYNTPSWVTKLLLSVEHLPGKIWEPACGEGYISKLLPFSTISSDIRTDDKVYGWRGIDFLKSKPIVHQKIDTIITNPPYSLAEQFMVHGLEIADQKVVLLLRLLFLEGQHRNALFKKYPISKIWVLSQRPNFTGGGKGGMLCFAWFVWEKPLKGPTTLGFLIDKENT